MLGYLVGNIDVPAAAFMIFAVLGLAAVVTALLARKRPQDYDIEKMKLQNDRDVALANTTANRDVSMAKVQQNLITSHRSEDA